jgi:hypothetical protein
MTRQVELPDGVRFEIGMDPAYGLVQLALMAPENNKPIAVIGINKPTAIALCTRLMAAVEQLDDIAEKQGSVN